VKRSSIFGIVRAMSTEDPHLHWPKKSDPNNGIGQDRPPDIGHERNQNHPNKRKEKVRKLAEDKNPHIFGVAPAKEFLSKIACGTVRLFDANLVFELRLHHPQQNGISSFGYFWVSGLSVLTS